jgi:hypothetical protein
VNNKRKSKGKKKNRLSKVENAIRKIAEREGVTTEYVRKQMQMAILNSRSSTAPGAKEFWDSVPRDKELSKPEEFIIYMAEIIKHKGPIK